LQLGGFVGYLTTGAACVLLDNAGCDIGLHAWYSAIPKEHEHTTNVQKQKNLKSLRFLSKIAPLSKWL
jgi:hypothetical protein